MRIKHLTLVTLIVIGHYAQASVIYRQDTAKMLLSDGELRAMTADSLRYMNNFTQALEYWEFVLADVKSTAGDRLRAFNETGDLLRELNRMPEAKRRLEEAKRKLSSSADFRDIKSQNLLYWGRYYVAQAQSDSALFNFQKAAFLAEKSGSNLLMFLSWVELGGFYHTVVKNDLAAVYYYGKAIALSEAGKVNVPIVEAKASYAIAQTAELLNEKEKAIDYGLEALQKMDSLRESVHFEFIADLNYLLASLYLELNEPEDAIGYLNRAVNLRKTYQPDGEIIVRNIYYPALSQAYEATSQLDSAILIENRIKALLSADAAGPGSNTQYRIGNLYLKQGSLPEAKSIFRSYLKYHQGESRPNSREVFDGYIAMGDYFGKAQNADSAFFYYGKALKVIGPRLTPENLLQKINAAEVSVQLMPWAMTSLEKIAMAKTSIGNVPLEQLQDGLSMLDASLDYARYDTPKREFNEQMISDWLSHFHQLTEYAVEVSYKIYEQTGDTSYVSKAFHLIENDKLMKIRKESSEAMFLNNIGLPDSLRITFDTLNKAILDSIDELALAINDQEKHDRENLLIEAFDKMIVWRNTAQGYMKNSSGEFHLFDGISFNDLHDHSEIHLIEYFYGERNIYGLSISDSSNVFIEVNIHDEFENEIHRFLSHFWATPDEFSQEEMQDFIESSHNIYNLLVAPLMPEMPTTKHIVLTPDGLIKLIPFETLLTERPNNPSGYHELPYLIHSASISYISAAEMLVDLPPSLPKYNSQLTSFALKSTLDGSESSKYIIDEMRNSRLYFEGMTFRGPQATKEAFIRMAPRFEILYLLTHGDAIDYPRLIFNPGSTTNIERNLYMHEIYNLNLPGNVVVMTSTETGMGLIPHGESVLNMVRAFLSAGSGAVILGLWEAHDEHSKNIIKSFFRNLSLGANTLDALRDSKIEFLATSDQLSAHPHNWAELILYGESVQVSIEKDRGYLIWLVGILILLPVVTYISHRREKYIDQLEKEDELTSRKP